ncbi:TetR/AcrR family transcriptional regulator [Actinoplanes solisilvae]|uniref:TetR/AcrR family transcriptional regulator n=1 Tax=Actinoplanes solisilvae TaxID=2486853 RepID=UPI000FD9A30D|nr:TetR/AcrR family transcriptional regulator [Actinoplanes solisilvae]
MARGRREELLEKAYAYVRDNGISDMSLRPIAAAVGSSPRVLLYLFGSKDGLIRALLARARADELAALDQRLPRGADAAGLAVWDWLARDENASLLRFWVEAYARSLGTTAGPWAGFAAETVADWLDVLAKAQPAEERDSPTGLAHRTAVLAVLRGALLDVLATGDVDRTTAAVRHALAGGDGRPPGRDDVGHARA